MAVCEGCGRESPDDFGFCPACGAELVSHEPARDVRKVVTILFCDLTGSTAIGDRTDPESLRGLMNGYYRSARAVLERHGATVEKFVGDAVMAVFGVPIASEDDALRATRAAVELRDVVHGLGLEARIGVNTGDVVAGRGDTLVTGDAVNVAARLEQSAAPGEILLGGATLPLVRDAVSAEPVELSVKGKHEPVAAHRLLSLDLTAMGVARRLQQPMVGRERERARMRADFADAVEGRTCRLFTVIGSPGVGKSRLVADFVTHVGDRATIAQGRALSYGEGITYWPLVEMLIQLGLDPDDAIRASPGDTQLATRALFEQLAEARPLVLILDDVQWAEPPLLDLVEHVADWSREAPIFFLCIGRPELLDLRPGWGGGKVNSTSILLEPLGDHDAADLADALLADLDVGEATRERILATAEGNPLFLEELVALASEARGSLDVPRTIQAVLQARLDRLDDRERTVIERGSVEGKIFHRGAVTALVPDDVRPDVPGNLLTLVRKELVRPDRSQIAGDEAFRFRHLLIRDTAYASLTKAVRADLHERFAGWLDAHGSLFEQDELLGYHLEQAARFRRELDEDDPGAAALAERAAGHLAAAGRAAVGRVDLHAARNLLTRAIELLPEGVSRRRLLPELADVHGELGEADTAVALARELAGGDARDRANADALHVMWTSDAAFGDPGRRLGDAIDVLSAEQDMLGVARCERARAHLAWARCQAGEALDASRRAFELIRPGVPAAFRTELTLNIQITAVFTELAVDDVLRVLEEIHAGADRGGPLREAAARSARARIEFVAGAIELDELRAAVDTEVALLTQTGAHQAALWAGEFLTHATWLVGTDAEIEAMRRAKVEIHERIPGNPYFANALGDWALSLCHIGDVGTAHAVIDRARALAHDEDIADQILLDAAEARVRAELGERDEALALLERARGRATGIDMRVVSSQLDYESAHTLWRLGDREQALVVLEGLADRAETQGFRRLAARFRRDLEELR